MYGCGFWDFLAGLAFPAAIVLLGYGILYPLFGGLLLAAGLGWLALGWLRDGRRVAVRERQR